jgi:hypothetical protein
MINLRDPMQLGLLAAAGSLAYLLVLRSRKQRQRLYLNGTCCGR